MNDWQYDIQEFMFDGWNTSDGHAVVARHRYSDHRLPPVYLRDLTKQERYCLNERLITQLSEVLRAEGIAPRPELQPGNGVKKAGKPRWSGNEKHEASSDSH